MKTYKAPGDLLSYFDNRGSFSGSFSARTIEEIKADIAEVYRSQIVKAARARERIRTLIARVELRNPPFPIRFEETSYFGGLAIIMSVPHRDSGATIDVAQELYFVPEERDDQRLERLFSVLHKLFTHELEECFHVDGIRVHDPHVDHRAIEQAKIEGKIDI